MQSNPDERQTRAVFEFMMFLNDTIVHTRQQFQDRTQCSSEEASILRVLPLDRPLMVKEIAQAMPDLSLSKLTRVLDSLEERGYITRSLNRGDRRSFLVAPTESGTQLVHRFSHEVENIATGVLAALTPAERLILVELFDKIQQNWGQSADSADAG